MTAEISNTTGAISVIPFTGKETVEQGKRLAVLHFKTKKGEKVKRASICAALDQIYIAKCEPEILQGAMQYALDDIQDALFKQLTSDPKVTMIAKSDIDAAAIAKFAIEQASSKKLDKASILTWFDAGLSDALTIKLSSVLGYGANASEEQLKKLSSAITIYRDNFGKLSAPLPAIQPKDAENMVKALALVTADSPVKDTLLGKLEMLAAPEDTQMVGL